MLDQAYHALLDEVTPPPEGDCGQSRGGVGGGGEGSPVNARFDC